MRIRLAASQDKHDRGSIEISGPCAGPRGWRRDQCPNRKSISGLVDSPADERKSFFRRKVLRTSTAMSSMTRRPWTNC
jgi:hypothetical protein